MTERILHAALAGAAILATCVVSPAVMSSGSASAQGAPDAERVEFLAAACVGCHRPGLKEEGIPLLVGKPAPGLVKAMAEYRAKQRPNPTMQMAVGGFTDAELDALAAYFSKAKPRR